MTSASLINLWTNFRAGNEEAYTSLMQSFAAPLYSYGIRLVNDDDFIKDCIQDVFYELWKRREHINSTGYVKSYLFKALRLRIFREQRNWNNALPIEEHYQFMVELDTESALIESQSCEEVSRKMQRLLNHLPRRQKEILYLRFYEGLEQERIAEIMELNRQSVYNLLHEAIQRLRKSWLKEALLYK
jgi:RNA polymerase sigma factor (sigma-70 family)